MAATEGGTGLVLVVGSTGQLGSAIVWQLRQEGIPIRALVRPASSTTGLQGSGAELVIGDLRDPESLRKACRGCDAVVTTASSLHRGFDFERIDRQGNLNLIEAARKENVGQFLFTSTIGADAPDAPRIFKNKKFIEERLAASGLRHTILRPAGFMENLVPLIRFARRSGWAIIPGPGTTKTSYIAVRDIAEMARLVLANPPAKDSVIEFGGEELSILYCVALLQKALGRKIRVLHMPLRLLRLVGWTARPFNQALDALFEILEFAERKGLRADKQFLSDYPLKLTSLRSFVSQQLESD